MAKFDLDPQQARYLTVRWQRYLNRHPGFADRVEDDLRASFDRMDHRVAELDANSNPNVGS